MAQIGMGAPEEERYEIWKQIQDKIWEDITFIKIGDYFELEALNADYTGFQSFFVARFWNVYDKNAEA